MAHHLDRVLHNVPDGPDLRAMLGVGYRYVDRGARGVTRCWLRVDTRGKRAYVRLGRGSFWWHPSLRTRYPGYVYVEASAWDRDGVTQLSAYLSCPYPEHGTANPPDRTRLGDALQLRRIPYLSALGAV